ncbi:uncharacterized protein LOC141649007 [Silene latifolia]|uniref:uncharacterized protein LOC141649007 n=1 Tax=Silene latifolia TaxID=37657 RepID=UPI003D785A05
MKKDAPFQWDDKCKHAFDNIKKYLANAQVLGAPIPGKPLVLYIAAQERSLGAMCAQEIEDRKERGLYYLARILVADELNYYPIHVVSKADPIKYILSRPVLSRRLAKWAMLLKKYDLVFVPQKAMKGQAIADLLADPLVPAKWEIPDDLAGEEIFYVDVLPPWQMYFDSAARKDGAGARVVHIRQWLRCLSNDEADEAMHEVHFVIYDVHQSGPKLHDHVKRIGYYWPTMVQDCMDFTKKCELCQFYANFIHQPLELLQLTVSLWPFEAWELDVVGPLTQKASNGHQYGVPQHITTDNGKQFFNHLMTNLGEKFKFKQHKLSMYYASADGLDEAFNKTLCNLVKKVVAKSKQD